MDHPPPVPALAPPGATPVELRLEPSDSPTGQSAVALLYGKNVRTVKRWVAAGREAKDPPPLDNPVAMPAWHERLRERGIFKQKCGSEFDDAIAKVTTSASPSSVPASATSVPSAAPRPLIPFRDVSVSETQSTDLLTRLQTDEARLHRRYLDAIEQTLDDATIRQYRTHWQGAAELLDAHQMRLQKRGEILTAAEADAAFRRIVRPLPEALVRAFPKDPPDGATWLDTVRTAVRNAFARLPDTIEQMLSA